MRSMNMYEYHTVTVLSLAGDCLRMPSHHTLPELLEDQQPYNRHPAYNVITSSTTMHTHPKQRMPISESTNNPLTSTASTPQSGPLHLRTHIVAADWCDTNPRTVAYLQHNY